MKETKYMVGIGIVLGVISTAILGILRVTNTINTTQFNQEIARSLSIVGIVVVAAIAVSLVLKAFKSE